VSKEVKPKQMAPLIQYTQIEGLDKLVRAIVDRGVAMGVPPDPDYAKKVVDAVLGKLATGETVFRSPELPKSPLTPEEAKAQLDTWGLVALGIYIAGSVACIAAEVAGLGQIEVPAQMFMDTYNTTGGRELIKEYVLGAWYDAILPAVKNYWLSQYKPTIPDPGDLIQMRIRGEIDHPRYVQLMTYHGFDGPLSDRLYLINLRMPQIDTLMQMKYRGLLDVAGVDNALKKQGIDPGYFYFLHVLSDRIPDVRDLTEMYWRGRIGEDRFASDLIKQGWRDPYLAGFRELARRVPGPMDLIRFYVREAYIPEMQLEIPTDFISDMKLQGYEERWTKLFWGAHWVLVPVGQLYEMYHRRIIDYPTLVEQLKFHDYTSPWRSRLIQTAYRVWRLLDLRYGWQLGFLTDAGLIDKLLDYGYSPQDAPNIAKVHMERVLETHKMTYARAVAQGYRKRIYTREQAIAKMRSVQVIDPVIGYMLNAEEVKREIGATEPDEEPRILTASQVLQAYKYGVLTRAVSLTRLTGMGYASADALVLLDINAPKQSTEATNTKLVTQAEYLFKEGLMAEDEFAGWLRKAGLTEPEIQRELDATNLRYRYDYTMDVIASLKDAFQKDLITEDDLYDSLVNQDMVPERARVLVAAQVIKKLPRGKAA